MQRAPVKSQCPDRAARSAARPPPLLPPSLNATARQALVGRAGHAGAPALNPKEGAGRSNEAGRPSLGRWNEHQKEGHSRPMNAKEGGLKMFIKKKQRMQVCMILSSSTCRRAGGRQDSPAKYSVASTEGARRPQEAGRPSAGRWKEHENEGHRRPMNANEGQ